MSGMNDEITMRARLQQVAAYRELRRSVQRSGRENILFALVMFGIVYFLYSNGAPQSFLILNAILIAGELFVGLFKWLVPTAEGLILDALVLLTFAAVNLGMAYIQFQNGRGPSPITVFFGLYMLHGAFHRFKYYGFLRKLFAERPSSEHIAWFDDFVREIQASDPHLDQSALDLPSRPHMKAKLLGNTAYFAAVDGSAVWVLGPGEFTLKREKTERGTGYRKALLSIHGEGYPEFDLEDASWENYQKWMASQPTGEREA